MKAAQLNLRGHALAGALALEAQFPSVVFTSGRRGVADQARAMAGNVVKNRAWISQTYRATAESQALQAAVTAAVGARAASEIEAVLFRVMSPWSDAQKARLSSHFSGDAFDVQPTPGARGEAIKAVIRARPGLSKFLEREGGLIRWHAQFHPPAA